MVKYSKQRNKTDCGPTAVLNALKWAGYSVSIRKGYKSIKKNCKYRPVFGTSSSNILWTLRKYKKLKTRVLVRPTLSQLDKLLEKGYVFILRYTHDHGESGHCIFCFGKTDFKYLLINDSSIKTYRGRTRKTLNSYLRKQRYSDGTYAPARVICIKKTKNNPTFPFKDI